MIFAAFLIAAVAGLIAHKLTSDSALEDFENTHLPSRAAWEHALGSFGFHSLSKPDEIHRAARKLPLRSDLKGSVWTTHDLKWVVIFGEDDTTAHPFHIYCWGECRPDPLDWEPMPDGATLRGWRAFDSLQARLEKNPLKALIAKKAGSKGYQNRGEIRY